MLRSSLPVLPLLLATAAAGCAKAPPEVAPVPQEPVAGYYRIEGHTCYAPADFGKMTRSEAQTARIAAIEDAKALWRGEVDQAVSFSASAVTELDDQVLNNPGDLGPILRESQRQCEAWAGGSITESQWQEALLAYARGLGEGRCEVNEFGYIANNLSLTSDWQLPVPLCQGQVVTIAVSGGRYSIHMPQEGEKREPVWITADGDPDEKAKGDGYPCQDPVCKPGQVIAAFVPWEGQGEVFPVGRGLTFEARTHGTLSFRINDSTYQDNHFFEKDQLPEFLLVEIKPADM